jgi:hypothetical protein
MVAEAEPSTKFMKQIMWQRQIELVGSDKPLRSKMALQWKKMNNYGKGVIY